MPIAPSHATSGVVLAAVVGVTTALSVTAFEREAAAQSFFFEGEQGPPGEDGRLDHPSLDCDAESCVLDGSLVIQGALAVAEPPLCPHGYQHVDTETDFVLCERDGDEMVRVGDFWVDRYEASVWEHADCSGTAYIDSYEDSFPVNGQFEEPLYACSVSGVAPARSLTWFQAQAACSASGKHLITNAEWQAAVAGTDDPGDSEGDDGTCVTFGDEVRSTGGGTACVSYWGAEDMIGNIIETTAEWWGQGDDDHSGYQEGRVGDCWHEEPSYRCDGYWNVDRAEFWHGPHSTSFPAIALRSGGFGSRSHAGAFFTALSVSPTFLYIDWLWGFRCARSH